MSKDCESLQRRTAPTRAAASWDEVLFVCAKCMKRQKGEWSGPPLRKQLKHALKAQGLAKQIRVVSCSCLDLCPKHAVTLARGRELGGAPGDAKKLRVVRHDDDLQMVVDWLLAKPV